MTKDQIKSEIFKLIEQYTDLEAKEKKQFQPGSRIPYAGRLYDAAERKNLVDSALDFWLTAGRYAEQFEKKLADYLKVKHAFAVNSGSSANLLAFMTLTSPLLKEKAIKRGDEVITVAAAFPTTIAPVIQYGAVPVFVDITIPEYNIAVSELENALSPKTKAVFIAHTLGNPFNLKEVWSFCEKHNLWLIEDNCDALGSEYDIGDGFRKTGTIGHIGTSSFYPAHHITLGEGGAVYTNSDLLAKIIMSMRDWGRDCSCPPGVDNTCRSRFNKQFGSLPKGYDHKYVYSHLGYNLKITEMQAAVGCAQIDKLDDFVNKRRSNWDILREGLMSLERYIILPEPQPDSIPSWFGFLMTVRENSPISRDELAIKLEEAGIQTRNLFSGNILYHPCFDEYTKGVDYKVSGELVNTDKVLNNTLWIGVYPGLSNEQIEYTIATIKKCVNQE